MNNITKIAAALTLAGLFSGGAFATTDATTPATAPVTTPATTPATTPVTTPTTTPTSTTFKLDDVKVNAGFGYVHYTGDLASAGKGYALTNAAQVATAPTTTESSNVGTLSLNGDKAYISFTRFNDGNGKCYADVKMSLTTNKDASYTLTPTTPMTKSCDAAVPVNQGDSLELVKLRAQVAELERLLKQLKLDSKGNCTSSATVGPDGVVVGTDSVKLDGGDDNSVNLGDIPTWMQNKVNGQSSKTPTPSVVNPFKNQN